MTNFESKPSSEARSGVRPPAAAGRERGAAMVLALIVILVMTLLTGALVVTVTHETLGTQTAVDGTRAFFVAEAGAARAMSSLRRDLDWTVSGNALGRCGTYDGQPVLYDLTSSQCMGPSTFPDGLSYPLAGPIPVSTPTPAPSPAPVTPACSATRVVTPGGGAGAAGAEMGRFIATYVMVGANEIQVRVVGKTGRAARGVVFSAARLTALDFVTYSSTSVDATASGNGTFTINGSVYIRGDWSFKGNSAQLNNRPVTSADTAPYDNQTYVCGNLDLQGNPQIGTPSQKMAGTHIGGAIVGSGTTSCESRRGICTQLLDNAVPDIRLADVTTIVTSTKSGATYTNNLEGGTGLPNLSFLERSGAVWNAVSGRTSLTFDGTTSWRLPKAGRVTQCQTASPDNSDLAAVMTECSALYNAATGVLHVAGNQVIYVPGSVTVSRDVLYRVDNNPTAGRVSGDPSTIIVACEAGNTCNPATSTPTLGLQATEMFRAQLPASGAGSSFPTQDMIAFIVNGKSQFDLSGSASDQEVNVVLVAGCAASLPLARCDTEIKKNFYFHGTLVARSLVFKQNVDLFQMPDMNMHVPAVVRGLLRDASTASVIPRRWREIGF
jgi:hypothetical protein